MNSNFYTCATGNCFILDFNRLSGVNVLNAAGIRKILLIFGFAPKTYPIVYLIGVVNRAMLYVILSFIIFSLSA